MAIATRIDKNSFDGSLQTKGAFFRRARYDLVQNQISDAAKQYVDAETGGIKANLVTHRDCQVCGSSKRRPLFYKNRFPHVMCEACGFVYVDPILKEEVLTEYYRGIEGSWAVVVENPEYAAMQSKYSNFHLDHIESLAKTGERTLLDIGCNAGEFLLTARTRGWQPTGHELNRYAVQRARAKGLDVIDDPLSARVFAGRRFGAVTLWGVLEHLPDPVAVLAEARALIAKGGVLAVMVPNIDALTTRVLQEKCNTFDGIEHVNFWNHRTLGRFLERHGFAVAHAETTISELYTLNNYLHYENAYATPNEYPLLLDVLTPEYVHEHHLGHHLCAYARVR